MQVKEKILSAIEKDFSRRYIATGKIQADGRLELNKFCINLLNLKDKEDLFVLNDNSSIILVKNPTEKDKAKVISTAVWEAKKKRLRLNPNATRLLMACDIGFQVFNYNNDVAIQIEPYIIPPKDLFSKNLSKIEDLGPYILRSSRSMVHMDILSDTQLVNTDLSFRIIGEYWLSKIYFDPLDNKKYINDEIKNDNSIYSTYEIFWFPVIIYEKSNYARPGLISFNKDTAYIANDLIEECHSWSKNIKAKTQFFKNGSFDYDGENLYKIIYKDNLINIENISKNHPKYKKLSVDEKGLMKLAFSELISLKTEYENRR